MASNPRSPVCRRPLIPYNEKWAAKIYPGHLSPLHTTCVLQALRRQPARTFPEIYRFLIRNKDNLTTSIKDADDERGFINGQKLERQEAEMVSLPHESISHVCRGVPREWDDEALFPQFGDLTVFLFTRPRNPARDHLKKQRAELLSRRPDIKSERVPGSEDESSDEAEGEDQQGQEQKGSEESGEELSGHQARGFFLVESMSTEVEIIDLKQC